MNSANLHRPEHIAQICGNGCKSATVHGHDDAKTNIKQQNTPRAEIKKPLLKQSAATNIALRGPSLSTHFPNTAAEIPRKAIALENIHPRVGRFQSPGADSVIPIIFVARQVEHTEGIHLPD